MQKRRFDFTGIGNAIVDLLVFAEDEFLARHDMLKGGMTLIDAQTAARLTRAVGKGITASGGSVANSCAVASALGARTAFLGKVADDDLGAAFRRDITALGVHFPTAALTQSVPTARCLILVTPDGQRTMNTYLGAGGEFSLPDLDEAVIAASAITYFEGYLFDPPAAQEAFAAAARMARAAGGKTALSLSDPFCVARHRDGFRRLIAGGIDILFANEAEICGLFERADFSEAARDAAMHVPLAILTQSERGSLIVEDGRQTMIAAAPTSVLDTTGAGDAYAAGFLTAYAQGRGVEQAGELGSRAAALTIAQIGARPAAQALRAILQSG